MKTKEISAFRLIEIAYNSDILERVLPEDKRVLLEYDDLDQKWHCTLKLDKEIVEKSGISLYNFYTDDEGNYYYPITLEAKDVE